MLIAVCVDIPELEGNRLRDPAACKKFPGAGWIAELAKLDNNIVSADVALDYVKQRTISASDVLVIQESDSPSGRALCDSGAIPGVLVGFESPLFASKFYDKLDELGPKFRHRVLYKSAFEGSSFEFRNGNHNLYFPIFKKEELLDPVPWIQRQGKICMVAALKHYAFMPLKHDSPSYQKALSQQLHDFRLMAIEYFLNKGELDLHGPGWKNAQFFCEPFVKLKNMLAVVDPQPCEDKIQTIRNNHFGLVIENIQMPGYITEKIIDTIAAGVIPIYLGAPDIEDFVPKDCFINMRDFFNSGQHMFDDLDQYLSTIKEAQANDMIKAGRDFLLSEKGMKHENVEFAKFIKSML